MTRVQRAGIVLSILWFVVGYCWAFIVIGNNASHTALDIVQSCEVAHEGQAADPCWQTYQSEYDRAVEGRPVAALAVAALPIVLGWALAFAAVRTCRWIMTGRWRREK